MLKVFSSLRARVFLLVGIPFVAMLCVATYHMLDDRNRRVAEARRQVVDITRLIAAEERQIIERAHQILLSVALLPEVRRGLAPEACSRALKKKVGESGVFVNMLVAKTNGDAICNAIGLTQPVNIADRDFFQRALQTHEFEVGGYIISRSTGKPAIGIAYPLLDDAGRPELVVSATLDLGWLEKELARFHLPKGSRLAVASGRGTILACHPDCQERVGKPASESPVYGTILVRGGEGTTEERGLDGVRRIVAFVPLYSSTTGQTYIWVGIPKDTVVGPVQRKFVWSVLIVLSLLVLTFGVFWLGSERLFLRRIMALGRATAGLVKGELSTRTGLPPRDDEIGRLAQSFDRMAAVLEAKERQIIRANRALRVLSAGNRTMLHARSEQQLLEDLCRAIVEAGGYRIAWAGYAENDKGKTIRPAAWSGTVPEDFFETVKFTWGENESGHTPPGDAIRTGDPVVVQDIQKETGPEPWRQNVLRCGCGSSVALPLRIGERVIGVLDVCAEETGAFDAEEVELLGEAAADLSYGIAALRGVTELAPLKAALKTAEERLRAAIEANLDAIFILKSVRDPKGDIVDFEFTDINKGAEQMLGMARDKVIGRKLCELLPVNRTGGFFDKYSRVAITGKPLEEEFAIDMPEIKAKWLRHQVVRVDDGIAISSRDITAWKEAGNRLKENEERLRQATKAARMCAWQWDLVEDKRYFDAETCRLLGIDPAAFTGAAEEFFSAVHPDDREILKAASARTIARNVPYEPEYRTIWPDGSIHYIAARGNLVRDGKGRPTRINGLIWDVTERKQGERALVRANRALRTLSACNEALVRAGSESELLDSICRLIVETGGYRMAWVGVPGQDPAKTVHPVAHSGYEEGYLAVAKFSWADVELGRGPTGTAIRTGSVHVNPNFLTNPNLGPWREPAQQRGYQSSIALPLRSASGMLGALTIYAQEPDAFNEDEVTLLQELAGDLAYGIEAIRTRIDRDRVTYEQLHHAEMLRQSLEDSIKAIADTVEMRDAYTAGHQRRVGDLAVAISKELGLPEDTIRGIELAASIHDLGKINVPAEILAKPGRLTEIEFMLIKTHPQSGYDILKDIKFPWPIAAIVRQHHERLDGSGYPQGLKGGEILLESRIMAVADVVEAMSSHRPYRPALGIDVALKEIERGRGMVYDPSVVDCCLKLFREKAFSFREK